MVKHLALPPVNLRVEKILLLNHLMTLFCQLSRQGDLELHQLDEHAVQVLPDGAAQAAIRGHDDRVIRIVQLLLEGNQLAVNVNVPKLQ